MSGKVDVTIGCNYEDFLRGLAKVKKEADLAVLEQRKKDQAERDARRAAERADRDAKRDAANAEKENARSAARAQREEERKAEREKREAANKERRESDIALREKNRQLKESKMAEREAARNQRRDEELAMRETRRQIKEKEKAEKEAARAAAAAKNEEERNAERAKQEAARNERRALAIALREQRQQAREKQKAENEAQRETERKAQEESRRLKRNALLEMQEKQRQEKEKERAEKAAVNAAKNAAETSRQNKLNIAQGFLGGGITGGISSIGANFAGATGGLSMIAAELVNKLIEGFQKAVQEARELRNLSYATDISTGELRKMAVVAEQAGISVSQFAHAVAEFNKNMGRAKIGGSELNNLLNKLGVSQDDLKSNSYDYNRALRDLAKAHRAGTDAATLAYYGNLMFGSSFEQLLPLIKRGTGELDRATENLADLSDRWEKFWSNFKNVAADAFAFLDNAINLVGNAVAVGLAKGLALKSPEAAAEALNFTATGGVTQRRALGKIVSAGLSDEDKKRFDDRLEELLKGESGVKLTPLGLQTAQGASTIQQMGGGDIVSAAAFSPAQATAEATQKTAENTYRTNELLQQYNNKSPIRNAPRR
jgi:chemotaxis protein histidine kinase CheA